MTRYLRSLSSTAFFVAIGLASVVQAQTVSYNFSSGPGGDGFNWPASPTGTLPGSDFMTPDGVYFYNEIGNNIFYDSSYQTLGNAARISGDALWGNPLDNGAGGYVGIDLSTFNPGEVTEVSFDIAWTEAGVPAASDFVSFYIEDSDGRSTFDSFQLNDTFTGLGGSTGYEDSLNFVASSFLDDFGGLGGSLIDIAYMEVYVDEIFFGGNNSEFAIDNFATNGAGSGLDPANSDIRFNTGGIGTNMIRNSFDFTFGFVDIVNDGTGGTTYSVTLDPTSDPEFVLASPAANATINGGETIDNGSGPIATIAQTTLSGDYQASATLVNDLNASGTSFPQNVTYDITIFDTPSLTDDSGATVQVDVDPMVFIANAAAGPHAGARRASAEVTGWSILGGGFSVSGLQVGDAADAGETENATLSFNRYGRVSDTYNATYTVNLKMADPNRSFLNGAQPVPDVVWNLAYDLADTNNDSVAVNTSDPLGPDVVGVNDASTAATLLDGTSSKSQTVSMALTTDPGVNADLAGTPVELLFSGVGVQEIFVLQHTYLDANIPAGFTESQMRLLFYDTVAGEWTDAVDGNSSPTTTFFAGSYADYLTAVGGGVLDAGDLGAFGIDETNNHAWAVLDHASIFGVGVLTAAIPGDLDGDGFVGINDLNIVLGNWNQNVPPANPLADPSGDGFVGIDDLNAVLGNWNAGTPPNETSQIPEPGTLVLIGCGSFAWLRRR